IPGKLIDFVETHVEELRDLEMEFYLMLIRFWETRMLSGVQVQKLVYHYETKCQPGLSPRAERPHLQAAIKSLPERHWRCDVCKTANFEDFEEACKHEETCQGVPEEIPAAEQTSAAALESDEDDQKPAARPVKKAHRMPAPRPVKKAQAPPSQQLPSRPVKNMQAPPPPQQAPSQPLAEGSADDPIALDDDDEPTNEESQGTSQEAAEELHEEQEETHQQETQQPQDGTANAPILLDDDDDEPMQPEPANTTTQEEGTADAPICLD
ncbi:MAG: hypothetical protein SGARI_003600, partial [Bacillariaceae sp.]